MTYTVIRSNRRTLCAEIRNGVLTIRAPRRTSDAEIESFLETNRTRIEKYILRAEQREKETEGIRPLSEDELRDLVRSAETAVSERVRFYAPIIGVTYEKISIRKQKTRWGSCSAKGNLSFNCLLMLAPPEVLDSVVVHELCHRKYMNHSKRFYAEVLKAFPEYKKWHGWLRDNGRALLKRLPE